MSLRRTFLLIRSSSSSHFSSNPNRLIQPHQKDDDEGGNVVTERSDDRWSRMLPDLLTEIIRRSSRGRIAGRRGRTSSLAPASAGGGGKSRWRWSDRRGKRGRSRFPSPLRSRVRRSFQCSALSRGTRRTLHFIFISAWTQTFMDKGKFLLAARRVRHGAHTEYIISLDADDLSQGSNAYMGKLRCDFLGTKFTIYDSQAPYSGAKASSRQMSRRFTNKQISPQVSAGNFEIGHVSYKFNILKSRGPRRILCTLQYPSSEKSTKDEAKSQKKIHNGGSFVLKNKAPRWHEHLQCWCLNFHGRVTVASVTNFQLVGDEETVLLQFGKVGDDMFTMDYRQPLSAFQAFAISLSSFGTKFACE